MNLFRIQTFSPKKIVPLSQSQEEPPQKERKKRASKTYIHSANNLSDDVGKKKIQSIALKAQSQADISSKLKDSPDQTLNNKQKGKRDLKGKPFWNKFEDYEESFDLKQIILAKKFAMRSNPRNKGSPRKDFNLLKVPDSNSKTSIDQGLVSPYKSSQDNSPSKRFGSVESPQKKSRFSIERSPHPRGSLEVDLNQLHTENEDEIKINSIARNLQDENSPREKVESQKEMTQQLETDRTEGYAFKHTQSVVDEAPGEDASSSNSNSGSSESYSSDSSIGDTLVEDNPYEERKITIKRSFTLRHMHQKLRHSVTNQGNNFVFFPDDTWKKRWDVISTIALLYTAIIMPVRMAFISNSTSWIVIDWVVDAIFLGDIIINFFSAYLNPDYTLVTDRKQIMMNYLKGWFIIDLICVFPVQVFDSEPETVSYNHLIKLARIPRLYRLVKVFKLVRMVKVVRNKKHFKSYMNSALNYLDPTIERLAFAILGILLFCHISCCLWYMLASLSDSEISWIDLHQLEYISDFDQYIACFYLIVQTVVTVGYGDMTPIIAEQKLFACFYMAIGVIFYAVFISFLSSIISEIESYSQKYSQKLTLLWKIKKEYKLSVSFTKQLISAIKYQNKQKLDYTFFLDALPTHLSVELSYLMYKEVVDNIPFFQNRPKSFMAFIGPLLRPMKILKNEYIFMEGDPADEVFFIKSGKISYVLPKYNNFEFLKVKEGYFFGEVDLLFYGEIRRYTARAMKDCEFYVLNKKDFKKVFLNEHREIGEEIYENGQERKTRTRKIYKEALEVCKTYKSNLHRGDAQQNKKRLSVFKSNYLQLHRNETDSLSSDESDTRTDLLAQIKEDEEHSERSRSLSKLGDNTPKTPHGLKAGLMAIQAAMILQKNNPFEIKTSFKDIIEMQKAKVEGEKKVKDLKEKMESLEEQLNTVVSLTKVLGEKMNTEPTLNSLPWAKGLPKTLASKTEKSELKAQDSVELESPELPVKSSEKLIRDSNQEEENSTMSQMKKHPKRIFQFQKTPEEEMILKESGTE